MMMMIAPISRARKEGKEGGGEGRVGGEISEEEEEGNADYGGMLQPSQ